MPLCRRKCLRDEEEAMSYSPAACAPASRPNTAPDMRPVPPG
jgi:hypothetical protein